MAKALPLLAILLVLAAAGGAAAWAGDLRPIDRLGSRPPLSSAQGSPAERALRDAQRQDLRGQIRRLEAEKGRRGDLSPTRRAQRAFPPSPAPSARRLDEARRDLNRLRHLDQP